MKQMFDISEKLVTEQSDKIYGVKTINWEDSSWKYLSLIGDEQVISIQRHKSPRIFRFCIVSGQKNTRTLAPTQHGKKDWRGSEVHRNTETWTELMVSQLIQMEYFTKIHHIAAQPQSSRVTVEIG